MRICYFSSANSLQGGAERSQVRLVRHRLSLGDRVHVVLPFESELTAHYRRLGARVHVIYWQHLQTLGDLPHVLRYLLYLPVITLRLARLLRRERIELLHVNEILDLQGLVAARIAGVPALTYVRYVLPNRLLRRIVALLAVALADRVVCNSHACRRLAMEASGSAKIRVIHNGGPDLEEFDPARVEPERPESVPAGAVVIGTVAKLVEEKGHHMMVELAKRLTMLGYRELHYVTVGGPVPGHERYARRIHRSIQQAGLEKRWHFLGKRTSVAAPMAGMDIVCHLATCEDTFPAVPQEAAALGKPVLAFRVGGIPEVLTHPGSIRWVELGDIEGLIRQARELLDDPRLRQRIGRAACEEIRRRVSLSRHFAAVDALYREMLRD